MPINAHASTYIILGIILRGKLLGNWIGSFDVGTQMTHVSVGTALCCTDVRKNKCSWNLCIQFLGWINKQVLRSVMEVGYDVAVTSECSDRARNRDVQGVDVQGVLFPAWAISAGMTLQWVFIRLSGCHHHCDRLSSYLQWLSTVWSLTTHIWVVPHR